MEGVTMNDDVVRDARGCEELRLIRAFLRLRDPGRRQRVLELAEQLAEEAGSAATGPAVPAHHPSSRLETSPGQAE
uniref:Uncharacterized protein n=1 Tax=Bradyrhizobium amphicarpaeae TaxID=1404768 RepID=A0A2U8PNQ9_9BRAD|nr:hypothetical protein CIT40_03885 [Bradyrhizobium amphicarpaeae]